MLVDIEVIVTSSTQKMLHYMETIQVSHFACHVRLNLVHNVGLLHMCVERAVKLREEASGSCD